MIENSTISYAVIVFIFMVNFVMSAFMLHVVVARMRHLLPRLYWAFFVALCYEGILALASFYPVLSPNESIGGVSLSVWLNAAYASAFAVLNSIVVVFHLSTNRWKQHG